MKYSIIPLAIFVSLVVFLWVGLGLNPRDLPSTRIDKPAPAFDLAQLHKPEQKITNQTMEGKIWALNVWASWCVACRAEHPLITDLARHIDIVGLNYKDAREDAKQWLQQFGNPYLVSGYDHVGDVGIDYGVYGVPETFLIDPKGNIVFKHTGPITAESLQKEVMPVIAQLRKEP